MHKITASLGWHGDQWVNLIIFIYCCPVENHCMTSHHVLQTLANILEVLNDPAQILKDLAVFIPLPHPPLLRGSFKNPVTFYGMISYKDTAGFCKTLQDTLRSY